MIGRIGCHAHWHMTIQTGEAGVDATPSDTKFYPYGETHRAGKGNSSSRMLSVFGTIQVSILACIRVLNHKITTNGKLSHERSNSRRQKVESEGEPICSPRQDDDEV